MGLKIKSMYEVFNNLVEWITAKTDKITDFNIGSASRTLTEAIAVQFEEFYFSMKQNVLWAIENAVYDSFGFELKSAQTAKGWVTVNFVEPLPSPVIFPQGTVFCTSGLYGYIYYESLEETYAEQGSVSIMIQVQCKTEGTTGNIPAKAISTIVTTNSIIKEVYNEAAFTNGVNEETSTERKKRFQHYIKTLARGTADAIVYGGLEVEGVAGAWVDDSYIGYVKLYAHDSDGELPWTLQQAILKNLENYRSGGIEVEVLPIVKRTFDISITIMLHNDYSTETYEELIGALVTQYLNEYTVASNFYVADIIHAIKDAYEDIVINITMGEEVEDTVIAQNELLRAGEVKITCINMKDWRS